MDLSICRWSHTTRCQIPLLVFNHSLKVFLLTIAARYFSSQYVFTQEMNGRLSAFQLDTNNKSIVKKASLRIFIENYKINNEFPVSYLRLR